MAIDDQPGALLQLNDALDRLAEIDARLASVVEYRFFGGLTNEEIAEQLHCVPRTIERKLERIREKWSQEPPS